MEANRTRKERLRGRRRCQRKTIRFLNGQCRFPKYPQWIQDESIQRRDKAIQKVTRRIVKELIETTVEYIISKILPSPEIKAAILARQPLQPDSGGVQISEPKLSGLLETIQTISSAND